MAPHTKQLEVEAIPLQPSSASKAPSSSSSSSSSSSASSSASPPSSPSSARPQKKENMLIPLGIVGAVGVSLYLCDTVLAEAINQWEFKARTSLHDPVMPTIAVALYLLMVYALPKFMRTREAWRLKWTMLGHNLFLSYLSLLMLVAILREVFSLALSQGTYESLACDEQRLHPQNPRLYFWYYVFYLSKVYEFIDTFILIVRKKPLIFLHVYHHVITLWLCWVCLDTQLSMQWLCTIANALVHVFMYYFYGCQALNIHVSWKKYLTSLQILQFILDEIGNVSWAYFTVLEGRSCSGNWFSFWFGVGVIGSFLLLFINFFKKTYSSKGSKDL